MPLFSRPGLRSLLFCALIISFLAPAHAENAQQERDNQIVTFIDATLATSGLQSGFQGVVVLSLKTGETLYERNPDRVFLPASNNKLLTSTAALGILGTGFAYHTRLLRTGTIDRGGTLHGDLILVGTGDPILTPVDLDDLAKQVASAGLRRFTGRLRYNDTFFDKQRLGDGWTWDDEPYYYAAQSSALNCNENVVDVLATPGKRPGDPLVLSLSPANQYIMLHNTATTGTSGSKSTLSIDRARGTNSVTVSGTLPAAEPPHSSGSALPTEKQNAVKTTLTVEDPSRYTVRLFADALRHVGIRGAYKELPESLAIPADATLLAEHVSPLLPELLRRLNKPRDNLMAECLLRTVGAVRKAQGATGATGSGPDAARAFFASLGLDTSRLLQADGSGLSRTDFVSPRILVKILAYLHTRPDFDVLYTSLPIAGVDGTLRNRMKGTLAANNCHAKTGTLSHASSLSGYVTTRDGELLAFSILMNNHLAPNATAIAAQDKIAVYLASYSRMASALSPTAVLSAPISVSQAEIPRQTGGVQ